MKTQTNKKAFLLLIGYLCFLMLIFWFPFTPSRISVFNMLHDPARPTYQDYARFINWIPFYEMIQGWAVSRENIIRPLILHGIKMILIVPVGFLSCFIYLNKWIKYLTIPLGLFALEFMQIVFNIGISDIDVVIFMIAGYAIGIIIGRKVMQTKTDGKSKHPTIKA